MMEIGELADRVFMIMLTDFLDTYTFSLKNVMKCCKEILLPDGKQIPFCAYNNMGYREAARMQLAARERDRARRATPAMEMEPSSAKWSRCALYLDPMAGGLSHRRSCASGSSSGIRGSPTTTSPTDDERSHCGNVDGSR